MPTNQWLVSQASQHHVKCYHNDSFYYLSKREQLNFLPHFLCGIFGLNISVQKCMWKMKPVARLHLQKLYMLISLLLFVFLKNLNQINMQLSLSFYSKFTRKQTLKSYTKVVRSTEYLCNKEETVSYNEAIILTSAINMNL